MTRIRRVTGDAGSGEPDGAHTVFPTSVRST
jgi:hypothetical protein